MYCHFEPKVIMKWKNNVRMLFHQYSFLFNQSVLSFEHALHVRSCSKHQCRFLHSLNTAHNKCLLLLLIVTLITSLKSVFFKFIYHTNTGYTLTYDYVILQIDAIWENDRVSLCSFFQIAALTKSLWQEVLQDTYKLRTSQGY